MLCRKKIVREYEKAPGLEDENENEVGREQENQLLGETLSLGQAFYTICYLLIRSIGYLEDMAVWADASECRPLIVMLPTYHTSHEKWE